MYTYDVHISYRWISNYFPLRPYYLTKQTILFHQCFVGVSAQHYVSSRFLGSCVAGLVQLPTCHRRWQREPVIALVAPLQTVQSLDIVGYFVYWIWLIWLNSTWYYWTLSDIIDWFLWILLDIYIYCYWIRVANLNSDSHGPHPRNFTTPHSLSELSIQSIPKVDWEKDDQMYIQNLRTMWGTDVWSTAASMYMMLFGEFVYMPAEIHNVKLCCTSSGGNERRFTTWFP